MSKPFNPRKAALRDPFVAFACDAATTEMLRAIVSGFDWPLEKVQGGGLRSAVQQLSMSASPSILFVDLSDCADPLNDINGLAEVCEPGTIVIAAGTINDVRLYRNLTASGIQDYLLKPLTEDQLRDAIAHAQMTLAMPHGEAASASGRPHLVAAVIGVRGGAGATSIAASCAWALSEANRRPTALLDLDVHFGTGALALDLEPGRGLTDAIENPSRIDGLFIERAMVRASDTLAVLSAEAPLSQPLAEDGTAFLHLQEELKQAFECTVIDLPRSLVVQYPHLLHEAQAIIVVTELTLAAARDTIRLLSSLKTNAPHAQVIIAANKVVPGQPEVSRKDFEGSIERAVDFIIPYDQKLAAQAARLGKPMAEAGKSSRTGQALAGLAGRLATLLDSAAKPTGKSGGGGSLLGRLGDLRGLLGNGKG